MRAFTVFVGAVCVGIGALAVVRGEPQAPQAAPAFPVSIRVDAGKSTGPLKQIWRYFGADEPNYAYMTTGKKLIADQGKLAPKRVYFRAHNLLTTGDGTPALKWGSTNAYTEDANGKPVYDWTIVDRIFDTYLERGVKPYVQIGFMPKAMSIKPEPYQHMWTPTAKYDEIYTGWSYPPQDYAKWGELAYQWAKHCVEKYGRAEVEQWYWETWNEANIGYWRGTPEEFRKLHDYAVDGVRRALPTARVGGPDSAGSGGQWMRDFLEHQIRGKNFANGKTGTPIDFVAFHAKGRPVYVDGHVRMGISNQLAAIDDGFRIVASYPEVKPKPIVIGESDPEGCAACQGPQLQYRNSTMYSSYTAASFARKHDLADRHGVNLEGALTWAFEFGDTPFFAGFRALATNGINLPVFNVFRMFSRMGADRIPATSDNQIDLDTIVKQGVRERPDVGALASRDARRATVLDLALPRRRRCRTCRGGLAGAGGPGAEAGEGEAAALQDRRRPQQRVHGVEGHGVAGQAVVCAVRTVGEGERARDAARTGERGRGGRPSDDPVHPAATGCVAARAGVVTCSAGASPSSSARR